MGSFARKYGNRAGSEAWTLVYLMKTVIALWWGEVPLARTGWVYGLGGLLLLICPLTYLSRIEASPSWRIPPSSPSRSSVARGATRGRPLGGFWPGVRCSSWPFRSWSA